MPKQHEHNESCGERKSAVTGSGKDAVERKFTNTDNTSNNRRLDHMHEPKKNTNSESVSEHCCSVESLIVVCKIDGFHPHNHTLWLGFRARAAVRWRHSVNMGIS